ncbi:hypothetical protein CQW23_24067 [Capsicum baccatum]|uniref:Uncharacterized protein n=1 Tax=Capsicum baccatum TaxID=33114 RepID=A0A2G2VTR5_CAPBA|nr:hypothetical protein CQW23_24067 [Capsicum baccatum]
MKKKHCVVQEQLSRCVMMLEVKGSSSSGIVIRANGTSLNFTPREFAIITGLNCMSNRYDFVFDEGVPNRIVEKYFNGAEFIQKRQLFIAFTEKVWGENNDEDAEKFAILYFLHSFALSNADTVIIDDKMNETNLSDSLFIIPDEFLPSLNAYRRESITAYPLKTHEEEPTDEHLNDKKSESVVKNHFQAVLTEIDKLDEIIPLCLQACDFYYKKGIDLQNHPRYKDRDSSDMFDVLFEENLPQQPNESLDCGLYKVTYAECLSYGHKVLSAEFDPNALRARYIALVWDYGIRKQEANAHRDVEAPLRSAR